MSFLTSIARSLRTVRIATVRPRAYIPRAPFRPALIQQRLMATKSEADIVIDDIAELYATAQDEFEIAMEETEKGTVYAEDDRKAAKEELEKLQSAYQKIVEGDNKELAQQVKKRVGQRIRELEQGVERMEKMAQEHD